MAEHVSAGPPRRTQISPGYALGVSPVSYLAITTNSEGLSTADVLIPVADGNIPGYIARSATAKNLPIIVVVHEIFGVHEYIKDICRRLARAGFSAIAPDLFARQGDASKITEVSRLIADVVSKVSDEQVLSDIDSTASFAAEHNEGDLSRLGVVGFCWGGRIVWLYAAHSDQLKAGCAFYGKLVGQSSPLQPEFPVDVADKLKARVLGFYGGEDRGIPIETVEEMRALLRSAGISSEIVVYPNAGHAFHADYRPSYDPKAAADAWERLLTFFAANGV